MLACCCGGTENQGGGALQFYMSDRRKPQQKKFCLLFLVFCIFVLFSSCSLLDRRLGDHDDDLLDLVIAPSPGAEALV